MSRDILRGVKDDAAKKIMRAKVKEGWTVTLTGKNHVRLTHPNGRSVVTALTGSGGKDSIRSLERNIRAIEEGRPTS